MFFNSYFRFLVFHRKGPVVHIRVHRKGVSGRGFVLCCRRANCGFFREFIEKVGILPDGPLFAPVFLPVSPKFFVEITQNSLLYDFGRAGNTVTAPYGVIHTQEEHYAGKS